MTQKNELAITPENSVTTVATVKNLRLFEDSSGDLVVTLNINYPGFKDFVRMFDQWETIGVVFVKTPDLNTGELRNNRGEPLTEKQIELVERYQGSLTDKLSFVKELKTVGAMSSNSPASARPGGGDTQIETVVEKYKKATMSEKAKMLFEA